MPFQRAIQLKFSHSDIGFKILNKYSQISKETVEVQHKSLKLKSYIIGDIPT